MDRSIAVKVIVCTGDSHTCGQGATGFVHDNGKEYNPKGKGIGRNITFSGRCYVNLIRNYITETTRSTAIEINAHRLSEMSGLPVINKCIKLDKPLKLTLDADLILIMFAETQKAAKASVYLNGSCCKTEYLQADVTRYGDFSFRFVPVFANGKGPQKIEIAGDEGTVFVSRIEAYKGEYAVINSGVGFCPTTRYTDECFDYCVEAFKPDIVIAEAHTINDWLLGSTVCEYKANLSRLISKIKEINANVVMTTVSPILGSQTVPYNSVEYSEFVKASAEVANEMNIMLADSNKEMEKKLEGLSEEEKFKLMFADNWHVNDLGHKIYADCIIKKLKECL